MLCVCQQLASIVQYIEDNLLLLVTSVSALPLRTIKLCSVLLSSTPVVTNIYSLMRGGLCRKPSQLFFAQQQSSIP